MSGRTSKRDRRLSHLETLRTLWADEDFGLRLDQQAHGRPVFRWVMHSEPGVNLMALERVHAFLEMATEEWVLALRVEGESWADIGGFLGVTGEAARRRFAGRESEYRARVGGDS